MAEPKKLANGKWLIRIRYKDPFTDEWAEKRFTRSKKSECVQAETKFLNSILSGVNPQKITFMNFLTMWNNTFKIGIVGKNQQLKIKYGIERIDEFFGDKVLLKDINRIKYQSWINWMGNDVGLAKETVRNRHTVIASAFADAIDMDYIVKNPSRKATIVGVDPNHEKLERLDIKDLKALRDVIMVSKDTVSKYFTLIQSMTGARYSEISHLKWNDVNYNDEIITIVDSKTVAGIRDIDVTVELLQLLKSFKAIQNKWILSGEMKNPDNYLFCNALGKPISNAAVNKYLKKKSKIAFDDRITSHAFRHSRVDAMVLADLDLVYVSQQIGHADPTTTLKYYNRVNNDIRLKNKDKMHDFDTKKIM
ncbi:tyrosine-type recombinase/integrase [Carnobacterium maltaromaticum]|uniref:tyrosine-type recombinase/integrase n=1 Tax=Carnobacterium maltaromaticum TaxID=2751 RepID=UPI0010724137|nr:site-specific integrase [Carnobacterium maltaromaticum]TFJ71917.1 hypothetical protein CKN94_12025 [Carnobacterium maltaromaticum]TFJ76830.1 hypothetical protein CKN97_12015 [Carnobacterium maltaromaticum]